MFGRVRGRFHVVSEGLGPENSRETLKSQRAMVLRSYLHTEWVLTAVGQQGATGDPMGSDPNFFREVFPDPQKWFATLFGPFTRLQMHENRSKKGRNCAQNRQKYPFLFPSHPLAPPGPVLSRILPLYRLF